MNTSNINKYNLFSLELLIAIAIWNVPLVDRELVDSTRMGKILFLARIIVPIAIVYTVSLLMQKKTVVSSITLFTVLLFVYILVHGKTGGIWHESKFLYLAACLVVLLAGGQLAGFQKADGRPILPLISLSLILSGGYEALYGLLQLYDVKSSFNGYYKITGTFFNPAPYSGYLVAVLPFALHKVITQSKTTITSIWNLNRRFYRMIKHGLKNERDSQAGTFNHGPFGIMTGKMKQYSKLIINKHNASYLVYLISFIVTVLIIIVLPSTLSRASWVGGIAAGGFLIWHSRYFTRIQSQVFSRVPKNLVYVLLFAIITAGTAGVYLLKKDSASGRLLIWKITLQESLQKPFTGHGFNAFMARYPQAQAGYFADGSGSAYEKLIAGNVKWAFNEPLQLFFEQGMIGLVFLLIILWLVFGKKHQGLGNHGTLNAARASIIGVMVFGLFSYPFYSAPVSVVFAISLGLTGAFLKPVRFPKPVVLKSVLIALVMGIAIYSYLLVPKLYKSYWLWDEAKSLYGMGSYSEANTSFRQAYDIGLKHNGIFLLNYGKSLYLSGQYRESLEILNRGRDYNTDEVYFTTLGDACKALGKHRQAERAYKTAANMVPHKFYPLYLMAKLYDETGEKAKARQTARSIINKEVKVHSTAIEEIKTEMEDLLEKYGD